MTNHDRLQSYFERVAPLIAQDPSEFYARAEHGRRIQAAIQRDPLTLSRLLSLGKKAGKVVNFRLRVREARR